MSVPSLRHRCLHAAVTVLAILAVACQDAPVAPPPSMQILDGAHNSGNSHFYFLPPMVSPPFYGGTFDPTATPEVRICVWMGTACGTEIAVFTMNTGAGSEIVRMEPGDQQYIVNWHTDRYNLDAAKTYRIRVLIGSTELGHADVDVVNTGRELKNVNTNEYIPLLDDRTLPIKFRIEEGAVPSGSRTVIGAGQLHTCALAVGGAAYCWGYGVYGQLGTGTFPTYTALPAAVTGGHVFTALVTGANHSCGLAADSTAWCWGYGAAGTLGDGALTYYQATPVAVAGGHKFVELASGAYQVCGRAATGDAWCWGYNAYGQVGVGNFTAIIATPQLVSGGYSFLALGAGNYTTCGVTTTGAALCWGYNYDGELGNGTLGPPQPAPAAVAGGHLFTSINVGGWHVCALEATGSAWCWGYNGPGEVTGTTTNVYEPTPAQVVGGLQFTSITAGEYHTCGLVAAGSAYCWGYNGQGQVGDGSAAFSSPPVAVVGGNSFAALDAGLYHTCGVTTLGAAMCWGYNGYGQLGTGTFVNATAPVGVLGGLTFETP